MILAVVALILISWPKAPTAIIQSAAPPPTISTPSVAMKQAVAVTTGEVFADRSGPDHP